MTNVEILDNIELDIDDFFKKKHIKAYNIDSWTDKKSERTFNYTYEIKSNKKIDGGALYDYLFSESDVLLHNLDMGVKITTLENTDYYTRVNIIISVPNELVESKKSARKSIKESVDKTFFDWMCDKDFFKGISKQITKKEKCQFDFYKTLDSYAWIITYKEGESLHIYMDKRTNDIFIHVNKNGKSGKDFKFPQLTFNDSVDELLDIIIHYVQGNFDSSWYESKKSTTKSKQNSLICVFVLAKMEIIL